MQVVAEAFGGVCQFAQGPCHPAHGQRHEHLPYHQTELHHATPIYEELPGWKTDITGCRTYRDLPMEARDYIEFIEEHTGVAVGWISVGPERSQLISRS